MVSVHGLHSQVIPSGKVSSTRRKSSDTKRVASKTPSTKTPIANAVSDSVRSASHIEKAVTEHARLQYDQPDRKHRQAMASYHDIYHQRRREELSEMFRVDIYV
ncbi:chromosome segregation ATPase [Thaumasiovibrio sp. DFM-14]|uniref:chromosome segregation ATPase n=1 Tax=Thaumasiovibrio sp. DFM-14 TaxID=3384792 RepID=UPI0039A31656